MRHSNNQSNRDDIDESKIDLLKRASVLMDSQIRIPGTSLRVGVDSIVGLIPGVGDVLTGSFSAYLIYLAATMGVRWTAVLRMLGNVAVDTVVGTMPFLGDVFDIVFKANVRNVDLFLKEIERGEIEPRSYKSIGGAVLIGLAVVLSLFILLLSAFAYLLLSTLIALV